MIYDKIKQLCDEKNLSLTTVEKAVGLGNGTISTWKTGDPRVSKLNRVAKYFDKPIQFFLDD